MASSTSFTSSSLYVGDLSPNVNESSLYDIFSSAGPVASVRICKDTYTGKPLGYAYVNFHSAADAERALNTLNYSSIGGKICRVMWSQRDPSVRKSGVGNLFIKNLDKSLDHKSLYDAFSVFGNILSCKVSTDEKGESLGYGFVHFDNEKSAKKVLEMEASKGIVINDKKVSIAPYKPKTERQGTSAKFTNVYVKNLPETTSNEDLEEMFKEYGVITSSIVCKHKDGRKFAFVNFEEHESAANAVEEMNGKELEEGQKLYVGRAQTKEERKKLLQDSYLKHVADLEMKFANCNLYVRNIPETFKQDDFEGLFSKYGTIASAKLVVDETGKSKGYGYVCYSNQEEARAALNELKGYQIDPNNKLHVALFEKKSIRMNAQRTNRRGFPGVPFYPMYPNVPGRAYYPPAGDRRTNFAGNNAPKAPFPTSAPVRSAVPRGRGGAPVRGGGRAVAPGARVGGSTVNEKQAIGEKIFQIVSQTNSARAGKITGMLLDMDIDYLKEMLNNSALMNDRIKEAINILDDHEKKQSK